MATPVVKLLILLAMASATTAISASNSLSKFQDLTVAMHEMAKANYFTFVTLINMSPLDPRILGNLTFLMPNDKMLSKIRIPQTAVSEFLLRHSIPSPLLFDHLQHFPTGSIIPSSDPEYMLNIFNKGRRHFYINNVKLNSPNICSNSGSSIRCHGIDGVLPKKSPSPFFSFPPCSNTTSPIVPPPPPPPPVLATPPSPLPLPLPLPSPSPTVIDSDSDSDSDSDQQIPEASPASSSSSGYKCLLSQTGLWKFMLTSAVVSVFAS